MKKLKRNILVLATAFWASSSSAFITQTIDISTGVVNNSTALIPYGNTDDTWLVKFPGASTYQSTYSATHSMWSAIPCGRWISPEQNPGSNINCIVCSTVTGPGIYNYKMNFSPAYNCNILSAKIVFNYTDADNQLLSMDMNSYHYDYPAPGHQTLPGASSSWNPNTPYTLPLNPADIVQGTNSLIFNVQNFNASGGSWTITGFALCAYIEITYEDNFVGATLTGGSTFCSNQPLTFVGNDGPNATAANYQWEILECDQSGAPSNIFNTWGSTTYSGSPGSFTFPTGIPAACNKYYLVRLNIYNSCYSKTLTKVIYINCAPTVDAGPDQVICKGDCITLTAAGPIRNHTYTWTSFVDEPQYAGSGNQLTVCPTHNTTYCVKITNNTTGCTSTDCMVVSVEDSNPDFNISTNTANNSYLQLTATPLQTSNFPSGFGYLWRVEELNSSNVAVFTVNGHPCWYTVSTVFPGFAGLTPQMNSSCLPSVGQFKYNTSYRITRGVWSDHCAWKQTAYIISYAKSASGGITVIKDENAPDASYLMYAQHAEPTGETLPGSDNSFEVFPNPGKGIFTIEMTNEKATVEIYDAIGRKVKSFEQNGFRSTFDLSGYSRGVYLINVISGGEKTSKKIILE